MRVMLHLSKGGYFYFFFLIIIIDNYGPLKIYEKKQNL